MPRLPAITSIEQIPEKDRHFAETIVASRGALAGRSPRSCIPPRWRRGSPISAPMSGSRARST